ncbi:AbrB/MazE/SpoVT family DNA-binding domain-containing protein [Paenibacillus sp. P96]|uniref:AbrB/MazE/SpoVT family DNA-binding domain-containing protein n=1 Tax=Paenibacillus zeirhizosphaerae TaxID=2987519 RepID=A0ABT9FNI5_9BACL|nr:AbrB/MazE/SpoVT family DNA-binding domain-containing protein [Paenibacillus sp. P96]MDP4096170.1 AbrB/MazE/SpoVT family DNA-binding domain-containing protein [Paenibacillus sp. P96]
MEWKRARVSQKRQVTIPQKLFEQAGIKDEVEFGIKGRNIIMRPVRENIGNDYFGDLILADLIQEGYKEQELLTKFRERQAELHGAVKTLIAESVQTARDYNGTDDETDELFGDVMGD